MTSITVAVDDEGPRRTPSSFRKPNLKTIVKKMQDANEKLDKIQKGLSDYLEMHIYFPRFFFWR